MWLRALCLAALAGACAGNGPAIDPLEDAVAAVGSEFIIELKASNDTGSDITFSFDSNATIGERGGLNQRPGGSAVFSWTPSAQDIGAWTFDFHALDAAGKSTESITIEVKSAIGTASLPIFRRPLGAGSTLDLNQEECLELDVQVDDQDTPEVSLEEIEPKIEGAVLVPDGPNGAIWRWCPTEAQATAKDRYLLTIAADDSENPKSLKHYQIILRHGDGESCGGGKPIIEHTPRNLTEIKDIVFEARVVDPTGLKAPPVLYWSPTPIDTAQPDLKVMTQVPMTMTSGDATNGMWQAIVPNLAVADPQTSTRTIHYVIVADDNDDKGGHCDHVAMAVYSADITDPGGQGGLGLCEPCSSSPQCGGNTDLCLIATQTGESRCFVSCDDSTPCPQNYSCSPEPLLSVDGVMGRQCIPDFGNCTDPSCDDDVLEPNASMANATPVTAFDPTYERLMEGMKLCPKAGMTADEDWFEITTEEEGFLNFFLTGPKSDSDVDLSLYSEDGKILAKSENWGPSDNTGRCVPAGTYKAQVYSYFNREHPYGIGYQFEPQSCEMSTCEDDLLEDDDDDVFGRVADLSEGYHSTGNRICPYDDDWYFVQILPGESVYVSLEFVQTSAFEDLDLAIYSGETDEILTQCSDETPGGCDPNNGQSTDSNESMVFTSEEGGYYHVIVRGYSGSSNTYNICIAKQPGICE
jgi:hypothetical protein